MLFGCLEVPEILDTLPSCHRLGNDGGRVTLILDVLFCGVGVWEHLKHKLRVLAHEVNDLHPLGVIYLLDRDLGLPGLGRGHSLEMLVLVLMHLAFLALG